MFSYTFLVMLINTSLAKLWINKTDGSLVVEFATIANGDVKCYFKPKDMEWFIPLKADKPNKYFPMFSHGMKNGHPTHIVNLGYPTENMKGVLRCDVMDGDKVLYREYGSLNYWLENADDTFRKIGFRVEHKRKKYYTL